MSALLPGPKPKDRGGCVNHDNIAELLKYNSPKHPCRHAWYSLITESIAQSIVSV